MIFPGHFETVIILWRSLEEKIPFIISLYLSLVLLIWQQLIIIKFLRMFFHLSPYHPRHTCISHRIYFSPRTHFTFVWKIQLKQATLKKKGVMVWGPNQPTWVFISIRILSFVAGLVIRGSLPVQHITSIPHS